MVGTAQSSATTSPIQGRTIAGKYRVSRFLGSGSMGQVYEAVQLGLERTVAIKVLHPVYQTDRRFLARFHREALAASKLDHPNSLRILDFGEDEDGLLYIAMELIRGRSLYEVVRTESLGLERIVGILSQVLSALAAAHDQGIIHRDVKPENVFLVPCKDDSGETIERVKVCDFGIAQIQSTAGDGESVTGAGLVCGTPEFMSPEQARALPLDARTDLYSCGIMLYELVAGRVPFDGDTPVAVALRHLTERPAPPSTYRQPIPPRLERLILMALEKDPDRRPQTAREFRALLATSLDEPATIEIEPAGSRDETQPEIGAPPPRPAIGATRSPAVPTMTGFAGPSSSHAEASPRTRVRLPATVLGIALLLVGLELGPRREHATRGDDDARGKDEAALDRAGDFRALALAGVVEPPTVGTPPAPAPAPQEAPPPPRVEPRAAAGLRRVGFAGVRQPQAPVVDSVAVMLFGASQPREVAEPIAEPAIPEPPPTEPIAAPRPVPARAPRPVSAPLYAAPPPSLRASAAVTNVTSSGSLAASVVRRAAARLTSDLEDCYAQSAQVARRDATASVAVDLVIDEDGRASDVRTRGGALPGLAACVESRIGRMRTVQRPDTGPAEASFAVRFEPR